MTTTDPWTPLTLKADLTWLQKHERLLIAVVFIIASLWCGNKFLNISADDAHNRAALSQQQLAQDKEANQTLAQQIQKQTEDYQATVQTLLQQNAALGNAIAKRDSDLKNQQSRDKNLTLPALAQRWGTLINTAPGDLTATATGIAVTDAGARSTVNELEKVPVLEAKVKDTEAIADNRQKEIDKGNTLIAGLNTQVTALNVTVAGEEKACQDKLDTVKADARKADVRWFKRGFVLGFVSGFVTRHFIP